MPVSRGAGNPVYYNVAWAEFYSRTKSRLHPSSRLATIDMGQKLGGVSVPFFWGELVPIEHKVAWATKWHLSPSSRLATTDIGQKLRAVPL